MRQLDSAPVRSEALNALLRPYPRVLEGMFFAESGVVTSCMDVSDGLGASLAQMQAMTGLSYQVDLEALPVPKAVASLPEAEGKELALYYGGDYELVATVRPEGLETLLTRYRERRRGDHHRITLVGKVGPKGGNVLVTKAGKEPLSGRGWEHFRPFSGQ